MKERQPATYHQDDEIELLGHLRSSAKKATEDLLTFGKFTTTNIIGTVQRHDTVDNEKTIFIGGEVLCKAFKLLRLHLVLVSIYDPKREWRLTSLFCARA